MIVVLFGHGQYGRCITVAQEHNGHCDCPPKCERQWHSVETAAEDLVAIILIGHSASLSIYLESLQPCACCAARKHRSRVLLASRGPAVENRVLLSQLPVPPGGRSPRFSPLLAPAPAPTQGA